MTGPAAPQYDLLTFRRALGNDPSAARLLRAVEDSKHVDVSGLRGSSVALLAAALAADRESPLLVVCSRNEVAEDLTEDLEVLSPSTPVSIIPGPEVLPYEPTSPDLGLAGRRMLGLDQMISGQARIFVTSVRGLIQKVPAPDDYRELALGLEVGGRIDLDALEDWLQRAGYYRYGLVEERGHFALRGGILDIFPPSDNLPVRIELFDDEVESIRRFDLESQRSVEALDRCRILAARPFLFGPGRMDRIESRMRRWRHVSDAPEAWLDRLSDLSHQDGFESYAPYFADHVLMTDYLKEDALIVWHRVEDLEERFVTHFGEVERYYAEMSEEMRNLPPPPELFLSPAELEKLMDRFQGVYGWQLSPSNSYPFERIANSKDGARMGIEAAADGPERTAGARANARERVNVGLEMHRPGSYRGKLKKLRRDLENLVSQGLAVHLFCDNEGQADRMSEILEETADAVLLPIGHVSEGFIWPGIALAVLTDHEVFDRYRFRYRARAVPRRTESLDYSQLQLGDFVVHVTHGIARYHGLEVLSIDSRETECLVLRYQGGDRLFVPIDQLRLVEKYVAKEGIEPSLSRLGGTAWTKTKARAKKAIEEMAHELLDLYARREVREGIRFSEDTTWQKEFEAAFIYEETPHQARAVDDVKRDMESPRPMDRLICGDVGYGKTEVALRASFKAVQDGKQVAVLVPTTILAQQHFNTFSERLADFPVKVEMLSRFRTPKEQKKILEGVALGSVDILIGTHRLLSKDIAFRDLGLLVIDEEQRFGVRHKEKLKAMKTEVDVLTMSATPIPRTLYMAMVGARDMSLITTPPKDRLPVQTEIVPFREDLVRDAILREVDRGGQVFFVHNRVETIEAMAARVRGLLPELRIAVGHGQMPERALEEVMVRFLNREFDVLVATMIIESGLDFPNVNTIIVNRADRLGLAQLYQLRGRVGRSRHRAFAYLLIPRGAGLTSEARKRLQTIEEYDQLGAGYQIAMRDLELRGAGNILGREQHGQIAAIGFELYTKMLKDAVRSLSGEETEPERPLALEIPVKAFLPREYVEEPDERMMLYRRLGSAASEEVIDDLEGELIDRFGRVPGPGIELLRFARVRVRAIQGGVSRIGYRQGRLQVEFHRDRVPVRSVIGRLVGTFPQSLEFNSAGGFSIRLEVSEEKVLETARNLLLEVVNSE